MSKVAAPLLAGAVVSLLSACNKPEMRRCGDAQDVVVAEELCSASGEQRVMGHPANPAGTYRFYYGGEGSHEPGTQATGGSHMALAGHTYESLSTVSRRKGLGGTWPAFVIVGLVGAALIYGTGRGAGRSAGGRDGARK